jgi:hypothetical protein
VNGPLTGPQRRRRELFREVNARILEVSSRFGTYDGRYDLLCECGMDPCIAWVDVPASVYEAACDGGNGFVVVPGHEREGHEDVLAAARTYVLVTPSATLEAVA